MHLSHHSLRGASQFRKSIWASSWWPNWSTFPKLVGISIGGLFSPLALSFPVLKNRGDFSFSSAAPGFSPPSQSLSTKLLCSQVTIPTPLFCLTTGNGLKVSTPKCDPHFFLAFFHRRNHLPLVAKLNYAPNVYGQKTLTPGRVGGRECGGAGTTFLNILSWGPVKVRVIVRLAFAGAISCRRI